jgi:hypothetical protein
LAPMLIVDLGWACRLTGLTPKNKCGETNFSLKLEHPVHNFHFIGSEIRHFRAGENDKTQNKMKKGKK